MHNEYGVSALKTPNLNEDICDLIKTIDGLVATIDQIADRLDGPQPESPAVNGAPTPSSGLSAASARIRHAIQRVSSAEVRLNVVDRRLGF